MYKHIEIIETVRFKVWFSLGYCYSAVVGLGDVFRLKVVAFLNNG